MNHPNEAFVAWLEQQINACTARGQALFANSRIDEANFEKIRANVYDIFRTVHSAAWNVHRNAPENAHLFFLQKLEEIPGSWLVARNKAAAHGDDVRVFLEELKLEVAGRIKTEYLRQKEATP